MKSILLCGSSTNTGIYINNNYDVFTNYSKVYKFSRGQNSDFHIDLKKYNFPTEIFLDKKFVIISLAPIWLFVPYLESLLLTKKVDKNILGLIIVTSHLPP